MFEIVSNLFVNEWEKEIPKSIKLKRASEDSIEHMLHESLLYISINNSNSK